jgi:hypothetical protein
MLDDHRQKAVAAVGYFCRRASLPLGRASRLSGYPDKGQRPLKETVYNASLVNCYIDADTTNGNMPVSRACQRIELGDRWLRTCVCYNSIL